MTDRHGSHPGPGSNPSRRSSPNKLYRDPRKGMILGVCAGIADFFGVSPILVRIVALIGLFLFTLPTFIAYFLVAVLIPRKPEDLYISGEEESFWRAVRTEPRQTVRELRHKFREMERRMRAMEGWVTSREFKLNREFRDLDR
jgi:phage shock protein C